MRMRNSIRKSVTFVFVYRTLLSAHICQKFTQCKIHTTVRECDFSASSYFRSHLYLYIVDSFTSINQPHLQKISIEDTQSVSVCHHSEKYSELIWFGLAFNCDWKIHSSDKCRSFLFFTFRKKKIKCATRSSIGNLRTQNLQCLFEERRQICISPMEKLNKAWQLCFFFVWHEHVIWIWVYAISFVSFRKVRIATIKSKKKEQIVYKSKFVKLISIFTIWLGVRHKITKDKKNK